MCLSTVYQGKKKKKALAELPKVVKCWKVVGRLRGDRKQYWPPIYDAKSYKTGWNEVRPSIHYVGYRVAFHAFLNKKQAKNWANAQLGQKIIQSKTEKKDIVAIGEQKCRLCIVTKRIWIPKPKKKKKIAQFSLAVYRQGVRENGHTRDSQ